jgi:hypothetical protein
MLHVQAQTREPWAEFESGESELVYGYRREPAQCYRERVMME